MNYDKYIFPTEDYFQGKLPNIMDHLDAKGKFYDIYFEHGNDIIFGSNNSSKESNKEAKKNIKNKHRQYLKKKLEENKDDENNSFTWKRISDIINIDFDKSDEYLINQNYLGDCYLISFLRSLQIFHQEKYYYLFGTCFPEIGYYEIYFFTEEGEQTKVFVDDYILVDKNLKPYFAALKEEEFFTVGRNILIEKAYAKMKGCYYNIEGGNNASFPIVGINSSQLEGDFSFKEDKLIYQTLENELNVKNIILCGTINEDPSLLKGLVEGHMYSMISTEEKKDIKIIKLNNPYGLNYPNEMKKFKLGLDEKYKDIENDIINYNKKNTGNGNLKIDIKNFKNHFDLVEICEFKNIEKSSEIKIDSPGGQIDPEKLEKLYSRRISILNSLGIPKEDQQKFINNCNGDLGKALYILFKAFILAGTSKETFYSRILGKNSNQNNNNNNSYIQSMFNYINPMNWFSK